MITTTSFPARDSRTDLTENRLEKALDRGERETLETCERVIQGGLDTFIEVGGALSVIRDQRLYRSSHKTFEEYCREKWDMTGRRARQLCAAAGVVRNLLEDRREESPVSGLKSKVSKGTAEDAEHTEGGNGNGARVPGLDMFGNAETLKAETLKPELPKPTSERQVRPLTQLPREEQRAAYQEAVEDAGGKAPTHEQVERAAESRRWPKANQWGTFDESGAQRVCCNKLPQRCHADIRLLQIGTECWAYATRIELPTMGDNGPLSRKFTAKDRTVALRTAAAEMGATLRARLSEHTTLPANEGKGIRRMLVWLSEIVVKAEGDTSNKTDSRIATILAEADRTVIQIRRLQDLLDRTDMPEMTRCENAVREIMSLEAKFKGKRDKVLERRYWEEPLAPPQKATKKTKLSAVARARISAVARARWARVKAKNSTQSQAEHRTSNVERPTSNGKGRFVVARTHGDHDTFMTRRGGWGERSKASLFDTRSQAEAALGGRPGDIVRA